MNGPQKYSFLKTLLSFHNDWMDNIQNQINIRQNREDYVLCWRNLMKYLISSEVDSAINVVSQWLPIFCDEDKFVLHTVAGQLSTEGSHRLGFSIANYLTSSRITEKRIDPQYMQYLSSALNIKWKLNDVVTHFDEDLDTSDNEAHCDVARVRRVRLDDSH